MSLAENKALIHQFTAAVFNAHNPEAVDQFLSPDFVNHVSGRRGTADFKRIVTLSSAFAPDGKFIIEETIAEGDRVIIYGTWQGTHQGDWQTPLGLLPATGKAFAVRHVHLYRVVDGRIVEHQAVRDDLSLLHQLGGLPLQAQG